MKTEMALNFGYGCEKSLFIAVYGDEYDDSKYNDRNLDDKSMFNANIKLRNFKEITARRINNLMDQEIKNRNNKRIMSKLRKGMITHHNKITQDS